MSWIVQIPWAVATVLLAVMLVRRSYRVGYLEGRLGEYDDDDGPSSAELYERAFGHPPVPTSMIVPFSVASRSELFGGMGATFGIATPRRTCDRCGRDEHGGECIP